MSIWTALRSLFKKHAQEKPLAYLSVPEPAPISRFEVYTPEYKAQQEIRHRDLKEYIHTTFEELCDPEILKILLNDEDFSEEMEQHLIHLAFSIPSGFSVIGSYLCLKKPQDYYLYDWGVCMIADNINALYRACDEDAETLYDSILSIFRDDQELIAKVWDLIGDDRQKFINMSENEKILIADACHIITDAMKP